MKCGSLMTADNKVPALEGYRWRRELVKKLLPCVKPGIDERHLMNLIRGYTPAFFKSRIQYIESAPWIFSFNLRTNQFWWKQKIEDIGEELSMISHRVNDKYVKRIFKNYGWEVDKPVEGISTLDKRGRWRFDAYKDRIAVEVELSSRTQVFKDAFKFLIGQAMNQIDIGIIMVRYHREGNRPYLGSVDPDSHPILTTLPMLGVAFYGFPNRSSQKSR